MRDYAKFGPRFWTGDTGKYLRRLGRDAQVLGAYLFTCPSSNMIGLYYLPQTTAAHETGIPIDTIAELFPQFETEAPSEGLRSPFEGVFARYDTITETVFVPEMARYQVGEHLTRKDNRHKAVIKELEQYRKTPFFNDFLTRYLADFELSDVAPSKDLRSPFGAPSKPGAGAGAGTRAETGTGTEPGELALRGGGGKVMSIDAHRAKTARAARSPGASRLPVDFHLTDDRRAYANGQGVDPAATMEDFRDYWIAASGAKARKHDWDATWRMWCRRQAKSSPNGQGHKTKFDRAMEALDAK